MPVADGDTVARRYSRQEQELRREVRALRDEMERTRRYLERQIHSLRDEIRRRDVRNISAQMPRTGNTPRIERGPSVTSADVREALKAQAATIWATMFLFLSVIFFVAVLAGGI